MSTCAGSFDTFNLLQISGAVRAAERPGGSHEPVPKSSSGAVSHPIPPPPAYQRRSNRRRSTTARLFMAIRNPRSTRMAAEVRSTKARSGLSPHR